MEEKRILMVEDERKIADTLQMGLAENGFIVDAQYDGLSALKLFDRFTYHLVILDINLPDLNGYEVCKRIRAKNERVPVIMLTALNSINHKLEGYDVGADDYIVKPFEFK